MRVARELHDAVAHNLSVIAIQAGGAEGLVERDPDRARQMRRADRDRRRTRRSPSSAASPISSAAGRRPRRRASRASTRSPSARAPAACPSTLRGRGRPAQLPAGIDLAAFRIVQEALANTAKHAGAGRAWVAVRYAPRAIELEIADDGRGPDGGRAPAAATG